MGSEMCIRDRKYVFQHLLFQGPRDRATAPSPTHTAALAIPGERTGVAAELGERRFFKVTLPEAVSNHYIFYVGSTVERSTLDRASVESRLSLRFRLFFCCTAVLLQHTHGGIVGCWWIGFSAVLCCTAAVRWYTHRG